MNGKSMFTKKDRFPDSRNGLFDYSLAIDALLFFRGLRWPHFNFTWKSSWI